MPKVSLLELSYASSSWISLNAYTAGLGFVGNWDIRIKIDIRNRADTNFPNSSPYTFVPPVIVIKRGTIYYLKIPTYDSDGDIVKCVSYYIFDYLNNDLNSCHLALGKLFYE